MNSQEEMNTKTVTKQLIRYWRESLRRKERDREREKEKKEKNIVFFNGLNECTAFQQPNEFYKLFLWTCVCISALNTTVIFFHCKIEYTLKAKQYSDNDSTIESMDICTIWKCSFVNPQFYSYSTDLCVLKSISEIMVKIV